MAEHTINSKIKIRKDTSGNWTSKNPILLDGELGFDSTNNMFKMGNGLATWNELSYASNSEILKTIFTIPAQDTQYLLWVRDANDGFTFVYKRDDVYIDKNGCLNDIRGTVASKSDIPTNYVTKNTSQTITGSKTFDTTANLQKRTLEYVALDYIEFLHPYLYKNTFKSNWSDFTRAVGTEYVFQMNNEFKIIVGTANFNSTAKTVTFSEPFSEGCYVVGSSNARLSMSCYDFTKTGFTVRSDSSTSYNFYYIAVGK